MFSDLSLQSTATADQTTIETLALHSNAPVCLNFPIIEMHFRSICNWYFFRTNAQPSIRYLKVVKSMGFETPLRNYIDYESHVLVNLSWKFLFTRRGVLLNLNVYLALIKDDSIGSKLYFIFSKSSGHGLPPLGEDKANTEAIVVSQCFCTIMDQCYMVSKISTCYVEFDK